MSAAEKKLKVPVNRILLSEERKAGRAYSNSNYYWPNSIVARKSLKDNTFPNHLLMRAFYFAVSVLEEFRPDFCLGCPTGGIINTVFYYLVHYYDIPYIACNASLVLPYHHFWITGWGSFNTDIGPIYENLVNKGICPSRQSIDHIKNFQRNPDPMPHYKTMWENKDNTVTLKNINKSIYQRFLYHFIPFLKREKIANPKPFFSLILNNYRELFLIKKQKKFYKKFTDQQLSQFKYIYYPFHLDPEIVLNVQAPFWHNQLNTIKMLSYNLPAGYKLIVREHRYNVGRRSTKYLKEIKSYPDTILVDGFDDQYKYIKNADLIITVNGTTGFEGLMLGLPVLSLGKTFYDSAPNLHSFYNDTCKDLGQMILRALSDKALPADYDEKLALFIDAERQMTLHSDVGAEENMKYIRSLLGRLNSAKNNLALKETVELE